MYQSSTRAPTLHQWDIPDANSLPLPDEKRKLTDVLCIIIAALLFLGILIAAIVLYNGSNLSRSQYPTDSKGNICALDAHDDHQNYPFLYFQNPQDPLGLRFCAVDCPQAGILTRTFAGPSLEQKYPSYPSSSTLGNLCLPQDDNLKAQLLEKAGLTGRFNREKAVNMVLIGLGIAFGLAILWVIFVQFLPKIAVWVAFGVASVLLIISAVLCFVGAKSHFSQDEGLAIFFGILLLLFFALLAVYACLHKRQIDLCGCFLEAAADCLWDNLSSVLHLLLFCALTVLFVVLLVFEYLSFSSVSTPTLNGLYYSNHCNGFLLALLAVQAIWGFSFFRDASNYVMSGIADEWYFHKLSMFCYPLKRLFTRNIGSVLGGSLISAVFYLPALIISFLAPAVDCTICNLFDLARSDVYAYIYLTGNSYCPSSRQTQYLCRRSRICRDNESTTALYAFAARLTTSLAAVLIVYWITKDNLVYEEVPVSVLAGVFLICMFVTCYFSDVHGVVGEALMVCFLTECDLEEDWAFKDMRACPEKLVRLVTDVESRRRQ